MYLTTLCYVKYADYYLMLHRVKKQNDPSKDKWIGIGGKFEADESPEECLCREAIEETGLQLQTYQYRGLVTFVSDEWDTEYMHLYTATQFKTENGSMIFPDSPQAQAESYRTHDGTEISVISAGINCKEGILKWIKCEDVYHLNLWEGDRIFLKLMENSDTPFFSLKYIYTGDVLSRIWYNGQEIDSKAVIFDKASVPLR